MAEHFRNLQVVCVQCEIKQSFVGIAETFSMSDNANQLYPVYYDTIISMKKKNCDHDRYRFIARAL